MKNQNKNFGKFLLVLIISIFTITSNIVRAENVGTFEELTTLLNSTSPITANITANIDASANINLVDKNVTINGNNLSYTSTGNKILGFDVQSSSTLTINNMTISSFTNNHTGWGGAIYNEGTLNLNNVTFNSNTTDTDIVGGGAITNNSRSGVGIVNISGTNTFVNNKNTTGNGGAIYNTGTITVTSTGSDKTTFTKNSSARQGGAIYNAGTINFIGNIEFNDNKITGNGAAIYNNDDGIMTFTNNIDSEKTTFSGNNTDNAGASIYNTGSLTMSGAYDFINNYCDTNNGAGIYNTGSTTLTGKYYFTENSASQGGAIFNSNVLSIETSTTDENLTFYNNKAQNNGGAITNNGTLTISAKAVFEKNYTKSQYGRGGAIYNTQSLTLSGDFDFKSNTSYYGGAIFNNGTMILSGELLFDSNISNNNGGAICSEGDLYMTGQRNNGSDSKVSFENNNATYRGGAIYIAGTSDNLVRLDIESVDFKNNTAGTHGGAIHIHDYVNFNIIDSLFENNSAGDSGNLAWGGALSVASNYDSVYAYVERSTFKNNYASNSGGAIASGTSLTVVNSKFLGNQAGKSAGAISYDPRKALGKKSFELIADGDDTVISGNWVADKGTARNATNAEGLYFGNSIVDDNGQIIAGDDGNDSNIYLNAGNSGQIIINDIVNALGDSYDNKREIENKIRDNVNNPNIQINKDGVTYHKFAEDTYDENEDTGLGNKYARRRVNGPKEHPAPTDGTVIFNNTVKGANLVLHNGTLAFGRENSYDGYLIPTKYLSDGAKITLKGGTLDLYNGKIESGDTFAPENITVMGDANLKLDLNFTTGEIDYINGNIVADSVGNGTLHISELNFLDGIDSITELGKTKTLQFTKGNELAEGKTTLESIYNNIITKNAGYTITLGTKTLGDDSLIIKKSLSAGGLPVAISIGDNSELSSARGNQYLLTEDEIITDTTGNNSWTKGYTAYIDGTTSNETTSNVLKGSTFTINGENFGIKTNNNVIGIEVGVENSVAQKLYINDVKKADGTGFSGFNTAIINNGGEVTIKNTIFNNNVSSSNGGAIYNGQNGVLNLIAETSKDIIFTNNTANGVANDIYSEGTINVSGDGNITFNSGIAGTTSSTITNTGNIILNCDNSNYNGSFTQTAGSITVSNGSKFFVGTSTITRGTLNWFTNEELDTNATLTINGADFVLGDGTNNAKFTVSDTINLDNASSITINSQGNLIYKADSTIKAIAGEGLLTVDGAKLTFDNNSSISNDLSFKSKNDSSVEFSSITDTSSLLSTIMAGNNDKLTLIYNNSNINSDLTIDGTKISALELKNTVDITSTITNNGTITNFGDTTLNSTITGTGSITNDNGNLTIKSDVSDFTGTFTQKDGSTTVEDNAKIFGGLKDIQGGTLNVTSSSVIDYSNIKLSNGASYTHTTLTENTNTIDNNLLSFDGNNSSAKFTSANGITGNYDLKDNITNSNSTSNTIIIENSNITLSNETNFEGSTKYEFKNSTLDLIDVSPNEQTKDYIFDNLTTENTSLSFNVIFKENSNTVDTDTITINNGSQTFDFGNIYISGEDNISKAGTYNTAKDVLNGATFNSDPLSDNIMNIATTKWLYTITRNSTDTSIIIDISISPDYDPLYYANKQEGNRGFQLGDETYNLRQNLSETMSGKFNIIGSNKDESIISGKIIDLQGNETGENGYFFNIAEGVDIDLSIKNVTIQDAQKTGNGSVVENNSANATITISETNFKDNTTTGKGGAIYNGVMPTDNSKQNLLIDNTNFTNNSSTEDGGAIYNSGNTIIANSKFTDNASDGNGGAIYNDGKLTLANTTFDAATENAKNDIYLAGGNLTLVGTNNINSTISGVENASITNGGILNITADNSNFKGTFTQTDGITTVTDKFFGGASTIENGSLNWVTNETTLPNDATLTMNGGKLVIGKDENSENKLVLSAGSTISDNAATYIFNKSSLDIDGADVSLNNDSRWAGTINLIDGNLNIDNIVGNGTLNATGGNLNLKSGNLFIENGSTIAKDVTTNISGTLAIKGGEVSINENDTWTENGTIYIDKGELNIENFQSGNGKLQAKDGNLNITNSTLTLGDESYIDYNTVTNIDEDSTLNIEGGKVGINDNDNWKGTINLGANNNGGELYYDTKYSGTLIATSGKLYLLDNSVLNIETPSQIQSEVIVNISKDALINIRGGASLELDKEDTWHGTITVNPNGSFYTDNVDNTKGGGVIKIYNGSTAVFDNKSNILITGNSKIEGGDVSIISGSSVHLTKDITMNADKLTMKDNSLLNSLNNSIDTNTVTNVDITNTNNFAIDLSPRTKIGDKYVIGNLTGDGTINVSRFNFVGLAPIDRNIDFKVFDATNSADGIDYAATNQKIFTPIGNYKLKAMGEGVYRASLADYNPQVYRGQVATLAAYNNQLIVDDILTNRFILQGEQLIENSKMANKTSAVSPILTPYQSTVDDGSVWMRSYVSFERLSMTHGLNVGNNTYGTIIGVDMPAKLLNKGWKFIPTVFLGYNGGNQYFNKVDMYQNGVQGGLMATFIKNQFVSSIMAYGGGYFNEMNVAGETDRTGNWFAGAAAKMAYNLKATKYFTVQPNVFVSYNIFGKQNWHTDYGVMSMNSGLLNGINVAPGVNFIYGRGTWSIYATVQYMYNINDHIGGYAGNVNLPSISMRHGYIQYGFGATKLWKDRLNSYLQITFRNGGRTGVGFQLGLRYMFGMRKHK